MKMKINNIKQNESSKSYQLPLFDGAARGGHGLLLGASVGVKLN